MIVKGGDFSFTPLLLQKAMLKQFEEVGRIASRRLEQEARQFLSERIYSEKSTGTLENSIRGYFVTVDGAVLAGVTASALELGQWELSMGEPDLAARATMSKPFDYAGAVEGGTGIYGPNKKPISAGGNKMVFWTGEYNKKNKPRTIGVISVKGQKGKNFLGDSILTVLPQIYKLISQAGKNIKITDMVRWK